MEITPGLLVMVGAALLLLVGGLLALMQEATRRDREDAARELLRRPVQPWSSPAAKGVQRREAPPHDR